MDRLRRAALLTRLMERLRERDSWCGETHVQKAAFLVQELMKIPLELEFVLYRHGPYSFDLRDELTGLRADGLVRLDPQGPWGPHFVPTEHSAYIQGLYPRTLQQYEGRVTFVAAALGDKGVAALERLTTAFYALKRPETGNTVEQRVAWIRKRKPHISVDLATTAFDEASNLVRDAARYLPGSSGNRVGRGING